MSEFDDRLRTATHAVGDRAQVADLLDRSLRTSRRLAAIGELRQRSRLRQ